MQEDFSDFDKVAMIMRENHFDAIIHFSDSLVVLESVENPLKYYLNNTENTKIKKTMYWKPKFDDLEVIFHTTFTREKQI